MIRFPNCKINIGLYITNRRQDGYHDLATIFYPVKWCDALEVVPAITTDIHISGLPVAGNKEDNLVWKAYWLLRGQYPEKVMPLDIYLLKNIPMGAGLGGGSADGAFMLQLISDYCGLGLCEDDLVPLALQLGSDCPFFIKNSPVFATGRGERMTTVELDLSGYSLQIICPGVHVSTASAFGMINPKPAGFDLKGINQLPVSEWKQYITNDFEAPVFASYPMLKEIKESLYSQGAIYAAMSGSGSAIYGLFEKGKKADIMLTGITSHYIE